MFQTTNLGPSHDKPAAPATNCEVPGIWLVIPLVRTWAATINEMSLVDNGTGTASRCDTL